MTTESTTPQTEQLLSPEVLAEIEAAADALKGVSQACELTDAKPEFVNYVLKCSPAAVSALCRALKAAWAKYDAEEKDHRLTIETFRQQERIWNQKYEEQEAENAALRNQLAQVTKERDEADQVLKGFNVHRR